MNRAPHTRCLFQHNKFIPWLLAVGGAAQSERVAHSNSWPYFSNLFKIDDDCEIEHKTFGSIRTFAADADATVAAIFGVATG